MTRLLSNLEIMGLLDPAAQALAGEWQNTGRIGWLNYLLEAIEMNLAERDTYHSLLIALRKNVNFRLDQGGW
jgi:hypothetical protein